MQTSTIAVARRMKKHVAELNLFVDENSRSDPFNLRTAIISTRVYIVLLAVAVIILVVFTAVGTQSEIITDRNPSQALYKDLLNKYATSLLCPCSHVTNPYRNFTRTTIEYHPVCSSVFVSDDWIKHLSRHDIGRLYQQDFRASASSIFYLLAAFCSHAKRSIHDALDDFHSETLLTPNVLSLDSFEAQVEVKSQFLRSSIANSFRRLLDLVRNTTHSNGLLTVLQTSKLFLVYPRGDDVLHVGHGDVVFMYSDQTECKCASLLHCTMPFGFFDSYDKQLTQYIVSFSWVAPVDNVTGFVLGCTPVESLLRSTLECLFDRSCLDTIHTFIPSSDSIDVYPLNRSQTRFALDMPIEAIINDLFIEKWSTEPSFSNYFAQCAPIWCTHTVVQQNNPLYVLTKLLGIYGGLTATLRLCVPLIIAWWRKRRVIDLEGPHSSEYRYLKRLHVHLLKE